MGSQVTGVPPLLAVAVGGAVGASLRYLVTLGVSGLGFRLPVHTLIVNVLGCLLAGFLVSVLSMRATGSVSVQLFLVTGLLGGFTTFSAFSVETLRLAQAGQPGLAVVNVVTNLAGALLAVALGWWLSRLFQ